MQELNAPPSHPVPWRAVSKKNGESVRVVASLWFIARREAMALLGCDPNELEVTQIPDEPPPQPAEPVRAPTWDCAGGDVSWHRVPADGHVKKAKKKTKAQKGKRR